VTSNVERERTIVVRTSLVARPLDQLRTDRMTARRDLELAQMRARQHDGVAGGSLERLRDLVAALTEELIARYASDLSLVESLLDGSYAAGGTSTNARHAQQPEVGS
jgi:hypothetical protein